MRAWQVRPTAIPPSLGLTVPSDRVTPILTQDHASLTHLLRTQLCVGPRGGQGLCRPPSTLSYALCWMICLFLNNWDEGGGRAEQAPGLSPPFLSGSTFQLPLPPYRLSPEEPVSHQREL